MLISLSSIFSLTSRRSTFLEKEISSNILEIEKETRILTNSETDIKGHGNRYKCSTSCTGRAITRGIKSSPVSGTRFSVASASPIPPLHFSARRGQPPLDAMFIRPLSADFWSQLESPSSKEKIKRGWRLFTRWCFVTMLALKYRAEGRKEGRNKWTREKGGRERRKWGWSRRLRPGGESSFKTMINGFFEGVVGSLVIFVIKRFNVFQR